MHSLLGTLVLAAALLQGAGGALRPKPGAPRRPVWSLAHRSGLKTPSALSDDTAPYAPRSKA